MLSFHLGQRSAALTVAVRFCCRGLGEGRLRAAGQVLVRVQRAGQDGPSVRRAGRGGWTIQTLPRHQHGPREQGKRLHHLAGLQARIQEQWVEGGWKGGTWVGSKGMIGDVHKYWSGQVKKKSLGKEKTPLFLGTI